MPTKHKWSMVSLMWIHINTVHNVGYCLAFQQCPKMQSNDIQQWSKNMPKLEPNTRNLLTLFDEQNYLKLIDPNEKIVEMNYSVAENEKAKSSTNRSVLLTFD